MFRLSHTMCLQLSEAFWFLWHCWLVPPAWFENWLFLELIFSQIKFKTTIIMQSGGVHFALYGAIIIIFMGYHWKQFPILAHYIFSVGPLCSLLGHGTFLSGAFNAISFFGLVRRYWFKWYNTYWRDSSMRAHGDSSCLVTSWEIYQVTLIDVNVLNGVPGDPDSLVTS